jgi:hypothetical protein
MKLTKTDKVGNNLIAVLLMATIETPKGNFFT